MSDRENPTTDLTPEEIAELFGAPVTPVPVDQVELEWILRYVEQHGHQP